MLIRNIYIYKGVTEYWLPLNYASVSLCLKYALKTTVYIIPFPDLDVINSKEILRKLQKYEYLTSEGIIDIFLVCVCVEGVLIFFLLSSFYLLFCAPVSHYHLLYSFFVITSSLVLSVLRLATPPLSISRPSRHHLLVSPVTILLPSSRSSITILLSSPSSIYHHYPPPVTCRCFNSINFIQILVLVYILFFVRLFFCFLD